MMMTFVPLEYIRMIACILITFCILRWRDPSVPLPDEEAFEAIKAGVDIMPPGVKMFLNSG